MWILSEKSKKKIDVDAITQTLQDIYKKIRTHKTEKYKYSVKFQKRNLYKTVLPEIQLIH